MVSMFCPVFPSPLPSDPCTGSFAVEDTPSTSTNITTASVETATAPSLYNVETNTFTTYAEPKRRAGSGKVRRSFLVVLEFMEALRIV